MISAVSSLTEDAVFAQNAPFHAGSVEGVVLDAPFWRVHWYKVLAFMACSGVNVVSSMVILVHAMSETGDPGHPVTGPAQQACYSYLTPDARLKPCLQANAVHFVRIAGNPTDRCAHQCGLDRTAVVSCRRSSSPSSSPSSWPGPVPSCQLVRSSLTQTPLQATCDQAHPVCVTAFESNPL